MTESADALFSAVYDRLKAMASRRLRAVPQQTLDTTGLVHELYLRLSDLPQLRFEAPAQFFAYAARAMRHLLLDRARAHQRQRAGGGWAAVTLDADDFRLAVDSADEAIALDAALDRLATLDARAAQVIELRYFAGLSVDETADALGISPRSVDRDWQFARAYLHEALHSR